MSDDAKERHERWKANHKDLKRVNVWLSDELDARLRKEPGGLSMRTLIGDLLTEALDRRAEVSKKEDRSGPLSELLTEVLVKKPSDEVRDPFTGPRPVGIEALDQVG